MDSRVAEAGIACGDRARIAWEGAANQSVPLRVTGWGRPATPPVATSTTGEFWRFPQNKDSSPGRSSDRVESSMLAGRIWPEPVAPGCPPRPQMCTTIAGNPRLRLRNDCVDRHKADNRSNDDIRCRDSRAVTDPSGGELRVRLPRRSEYAAAPGAPQPSGDSAHNSAPARTGRRIRRSGIRSQLE